MNFQSIWQALQDPAWVGIAGLAAIIAVIAGGINFLLIKPIRDWRARKQAEKEVVRNLLRFLENRRVLYSDFAEEHVSEAINSVYQIRNRLGEDIERLDDDSDAARPVLEMQAACRNFLSRTASLPKVSEGEEVYPSPQHTKRFIHALMEMRTVFDSRTDKLYEKYGIEKGERPPGWGFTSKSYRFYLPIPEDDEETR